MASAARGRVRGGAAKALADLLEEIAAKAGRKAA
jgi:hypothetical protein